MSFCKAAVILTAFASSAAFGSQRKSQGIVENYGQCGGKTNNLPWAGSTQCGPGFVCVASSVYYSQCVPGTAATTTTAPSKLPTQSSTPVAVTKTATPTVPPSSTPVAVTKSATPTVTTTKSPSLWPTKAQTTKPVADISQTPTAQFSKSPSVKPSTLPAVTTTIPTSGQTVANYAQCGGMVNNLPWTGPTLCGTGFYCAFTNMYFSQCIPGMAVASTSVPSNAPVVAGASMKPVAVSTNKPLAVATNTPVATSTLAPVAATTGTCPATPMTTCPGVAAAIACVQCVQVPAAATIPAKAFLFCDTMTAISIPSTVTLIDGDAFHSASKLTSVYIPDSVKQINYYAFHYASSLASVRLPNTLKVLDDYVFSYNFALTCITLPPTITDIKAGAFHDCTSLTSINIPASVTLIGLAAFANTPKLKCIYGNNAALALISQASVGATAGIKLC